MEDITEFINQLNSVVTKTEIEQVTVKPEKPEKPEKPLKILIVSTHINQSNGYSKVTYNIIKELTKHKWITLVHFATQQLVSGDIGRKYPSNVKVIAKTDKKNGFAFSEINGVITSERPDIVFIYNDMSTICNYVEEIRKIPRIFKIWAYLDITYKSPPQQMIDNINRDIERIFCFTKTWKDELKSAGITRPIDIMNHGLDSSIFPIPKELARQTLGLPNDVFLYTSLNKNIPRKRLDILVMSFAKLIVRFPTKQLFMLIVSDLGKHGGFPLFDIFAREINLAGGAIDQFGNRLLITSKDTCYKDDDINVLYNCGDVGVSCADGEGFGLCTFEQMSLGIPQIVPDINGYTEYCTRDNSLMIKPSIRYYIPMVHDVSGEAQMVNPEDVSKAMEKYAFDENLRKLHGKLGVENKYTWEKCCEILMKRLETIDD